MDNERKKYIITYVDRKTGKIKTDRVEAFTNRNIFFIRKNQGLFNYLYAKLRKYSPLMSVVVIILTILRKEMVS